MTKTLLRELAWLVAAAIITYVIAVARFGWKFYSDTVDINLVDTYLIVPGTSILLPLFSIVCFLIFFFKELIHHYKRPVPSIITVTSGILLIVLITISMKYFPIVAGFTMYPPLSTVRDTGHIAWDEDWTSFANFVTAVQAIVGIMIIYVAYRLGVARIKTGDRS